MVNITLLHILYLNRENMPSHFKIKEYCPLVFRNLRERFAIDDSDYRQSLTRYLQYYCYILYYFKLIHVN